MQGFMEFNESAEHYNSGYSASKSGKSRQDNPYKEGSLAAKYWAKGYEHHKTGKQPEKFTEETDDKDLPFTPDVKKTKPSTAGKYGSAYSTVRNLARQAMQKQAAKKSVKEEGGKISIGEETLIEKLDKKEELRAALNRHSQHAIEANRRGDDEAVKVHQGYMNKIKDKMAKLVRNEELVGKQHKLDVDKDGKIEGEDLAKLRKMKEEAELQESSDAHKVMVTVSDPNHPAVSQRKEQIMKHVIVRAGDKGDAQAKAEAFYKKRGYKVHGSEYHSKQPATSMKTEEVELEEASKGYAPGWMLKADPELAKKVKEKTQGYKDLKKYAGRDIPKKEELDMKTFSQFMEEIQEIEEAKGNEPAEPNAAAIAKKKAREAAQRRREEKAEADKDDLRKDYKPANAPKNTTKVIAGKAYGGAAQKDDEDETHPVTQKATEKRGRGRPAGSKSGARTAGAAKKSYGGLTFHSLSLPNSNK